MHMPCKESKEHVTEGRMVSAFSNTAAGLVIQQEGTGVSQVLSFVSYPDRALPSV